jgi:hypothetical protein
MTHGQAVRWSIGLLLSTALVLVGCSSDDSSGTGTAGAAGSAGASATGGGGAGGGGGEGGGGGSESDAASEATDGGGSMPDATESGTEAGDAATTDGSLIDAPAIPDVVGSEGGG